MRKKFLRGDRLLPNQHRSAQRGTPKSDAVYTPFDPGTFMAVVDPSEMVIPTVVEPAVIGAPPDGPVQEIFPASGVGSMVPQLKPVSVPDFTAAVSNTAFAIPDPVCERVKLPLTPMTKTVMGFGVNWVNVWPCSTPVRTTE
jgi:hypothetical protein